MMSVDMETAALTLIDMQQGMGSAATGERNNPGAERSMQRLLAAWRQLGWPVVHVHHVSRTSGSPFWPGQPDAAVQSDCAPVAGEHLVKKQVPDAFVRTGLERWLHARVKAAGDTFWGGYAGYFQDPDRHLWEVVWNPQWQP